MAKFDCARWRPISTNIGGNLGPNLGLVLHHQAGNGSLFNFFNSPSAKVSAHFWVSKTGIIEQYVDTARVAWHGKSLNSRYVGVETEGCGVAPHAEPMTQAMFDGLVLIYREGMRRHGWDASLANKDGERGFGYHRMAVATGCPCDVRLNRRSDIIAAAIGTPAPKPPDPVPALARRGDQVFIQNNNGTFWFIADGPKSYWRQVPTNLVPNIPKEWIIQDPNGSWQALWQTGAPK